MLFTRPKIFAILSISFTQITKGFAQQLSDTSGWALRANQTCPAGESDCGPTAHGFVGCCPASSPCLPQYNNVCCPPSKPQLPLYVNHFPFQTRCIDSFCNCIDTNCTDALVVAGPWCADPSWVLCNNNGYFCCLWGQTCYSDGNTDGCAYPGYELGPSQQVLQPIHQLPRSIASTTTTSSAISSSATQSPTSSQSSQNNSGSLDISDKIAIGIGVPVGVATILGTWITWKIYRRKKHKVGN